MTFRYTGKQRHIARTIVRKSSGWVAWAKANTIVSRELTTPELNRAVDELGLRLDLMLALKHAGLLPIWDSSVQGWVPIKTTRSVKPALVAAIKALDLNILQDLVAEMEARHQAEIARLRAEIAKQDERLKMVEIKTGLRFGDPEELSEVGCQSMQTEYDYAAFNANNPQLP